MKSLIPLEKVRESDRAIVGGKAAGLAALIRLGLPVPAGWVLPTEAQGVLSPEWEAALRGIRGPVAVRSSATVEDGAASAFAGVYHSELNVTDVPAAVRKCWAQASSEAAAAHALRNNIDPRSVRVALVIQEMVPADRAGVLFTRDPNGDPDHAVLSLVGGTGDRLMQGETGGQSLRVRRDRIELSDPVLRKLVKLGLRIERKLGRPQDIEWAACGDRLWFLQTRPITTIDEGPAIHWTREISEERFPQPISPLGWSSLQLLLKVNQETLAKRFGLVARRPDDIARTIDHYVYTNKKFFSIPGSLRLNPMAQARFFPDLLRQLVDVVRHAVPALRSPQGLRLLALTRLFRAFLFPHAREVREAWNANLPSLLREMDAFNGVEPSRLSTPELWNHKARMEAVARRYMEPDLAIYVVKTACSWMVEKLGAPLTDLTAGVDNRTLQMNEELQELATDPSRLDRFLERNGHLTTNWDLMEPTWGEAPEKILGMLRGCAASRRRSFREYRESHRARFEAARAETLATMPGWLASFFEELLATLHEFMRIDEEHHFYCSRLFRPMRRFCVEIGARLTALGVLDRPEDIWFLTLEEAREAFENPFPRRFLVQARRTSFERSRTTRPPSEIVGQRPVREEMPESGDLFRGVGASGGVATGVVRVVETPEDAAAFQPGEILVTATPNPAWTPVYAMAGALVTATGSLLSHGLVSAREYRLPAVIGIADASRRFSTGQRVKVDGYAGTVAFERA